MIKVTAGTRLAIADVNVTEVKDMASKWKFWANAPLHI
jgi:hypothetical protein